MPKDVPDREYQQTSIWNLISRFYWVSHHVLYTNKNSRKIKDALNWDLHIIVHTTLLNDRLHWFMLKIIGTDIVIQSFFTKTITWGSKKCPCLSALGVVSKIIGNTKTLTSGCCFWATLSMFSKLFSPSLVNLFRNSSFYAGSIDAFPTQK